MTERSSPGSDKNQALFKAIYNSVLDRVCHHHRNACYPDAMRSEIERDVDGIVEFVCAEAEKVYGAPAQAAQGDPVAWRYCHKGQGDWCMLKDGQDPTKWLATFNGEYEIQPLYAAQPQAGEG